MKIEKKNKGFMMIEVVIASAIIVISILAIMSVATRSIAFSRQAFHNTQATFLLEEGAEAVRINRDNSWTSNIANLTPGTNYCLYFNNTTWVLQTSNCTATGIFTRTVTIASVNRNATTQDIATTGTNDAGTKLVTITVSWYEGSNNITKTLPFYISNIFST